MDQIPLVNEAIEAGKRFLEEFNKTFPGTIGFWLKIRDERDWNLHIASPNIGDMDRKKAFSEIARITAELNTPYVESLDIKLQKIDEPFVRLALDWQRRHPGLASVCADIPSYYGVDVEGMYLYSTLKSAA